MTVQLQFDQNATGDESEAGPPSSQQTRRDKWIQHGVQAKGRDGCDNAAIAKLRDRGYAEFAMFQNGPGYLVRGYAKFEQFKDGPSYLDRGYASFPQFKNGREREFQEGHDQASVRHHAHVRYYTLYLSTSNYAILNCQSHPMWKHLSKKKTMADSAGTKRTNDDGDGAPTVSPPPSKGMRGSAQTMNVDAAPATDSTHGKPAEVPA